MSILLLLNLLGYFLWGLVFNLFRGFRSDRLLRCLLVKLFRRLILLLLLDRLWLLLLGGFGRIFHWLSFLLLLLFPISVLLLLFPIFVLLLLFFFFLFLLLFLRRWRLNWLGGFILFFWFRSRDGLCRSLGGAVLLNRCSLWEIVLMSGISLWNVILLRRGCWRIILLNLSFMRVVFLGWNMFGGVILLNWSCRRIFLLRNVLRRIVLFLCFRWSDDFLWNVGGVVLMRSS